MLNAANEVAVHAFLAGRLRSSGIADVIEAHARAGPGASRCVAFDSLYEADAARAHGGRGAGGGARALA